MPSLGSLHAHGQSALLASSRERLSHLGVWQNEAPPTALLIIDVQTDFITGTLSLLACEAKQVHGNAGSGYMCRG